MIIIMPGLFDYDDQSQLTTVTVYASRYKDQAIVCVHVERKPYSRCGIDFYAKIAHTTSPLYQ